MPDPVLRHVHYDCQDDQKIIAAYDDIGIGPAVVFDGAGFTDPDKLEAFAQDLSKFADWLAMARVGEASGGSRETQQTESEG